MLGRAGACGGVRGRGYAQRCLIYYVQVITGSKTAVAVQVVSGGVVTAGKRTVSVPSINFLF